MSLGLWALGVRAVSWCLDNTLFLFILQPSNNIVTTEIFLLNLTLLKLFRIISGFMIEHYIIPKKKSIISLYLP